MEEKFNQTTLLEKETLTEKQKAQPQVVIRQENQKPSENLKVNLSKLKAENEKKRELEQKQQSRKLVNKNQINFFGGEYDFEKQKQEEIVAKENSSVIEKPNYDFIEPLSQEQEEKIFVVEKQKEPKKKFSPVLKKIKIAIFILLVGVLGSWTIYNAVELSNVVTEYNLKLDQYLLKLGTLDSASSMNDLFPTYPEEKNPASGIEKESNWFDRFCNFIGGIFGG